MGSNFHFKNVRTLVSLNRTKQTKHCLEAGTLYKQKQNIVEHPYGTIKRRWGFYYIITKKGIKRASADVGLMLIAYNLHRLMNIVGKNDLQKFLRELVFTFYLILTSLN